MVSNLSFNQIDFFRNQFQCDFPRFTGSSFSQNFVNNIICVDVKSVW